MAIQFLNAVDVTGEVQGTSLDINGNADISGNLVVTGQITNAGNVLVSQGAPKLILKDSTDDDDQAILFRNSSDGDDYKIQTADFTSAATGDGLFIGSESSDPVALVTNDTTALTIDSSQNATFAGNVLIPSNLQHVNDDNNEISFGTDTQDFRTNNSSRLDISNSGVRFGGTGARITQVENNDSLGTSDTKLATQGNVKAYVDANTGTNITSVGTLSSVTVSGNINANGNIVGDDSTSITNIDSIQLDNVMADADTTTRIGLGSTSMEFLVADSDVMDLNETTLNVSGTLVAKKHKLAKTSNTDGNADGDIVYFGATTSMDTGKIYYLNSSGNWALADADAESTAKGMLGVALGAASDTNGVLIRGMVTLDTDPGTIGDTLFLSTTAGVATSTAPSGNGDIVRVIGYCLDSTNGQIYFNPDGTFVEVTA